MSKCRGARKLKGQKWCTGVVFFLFYCIYDVEGREVCDGVSVCMRRECICEKNKGYWNWVSCKNGKCPCRVWKVYQTRSPTRAIGYFYIDIYLRWGHQGGKVTICGSAVAVRWHWWRPKWMAVDMNHPSASSLPLFRKTLHPSITNSAMGQTLSAPITDKHSSAGHNDRFAFGQSAMQGWRASKENPCCFLLHSGPYDTVSITLFL